MRAKGWVLVLIALIVGVALGLAVGQRVFGDAGRGVEVLAYPRASGDIRSLQASLSEVAQRVVPAVVNISTVRVYRERPMAPFAPFLNDPFFREFFDDDFFRYFGMPRERVERSLGSGVIVREDGYIITNYHVIAHASQITVGLADKREFKAKVIGVDPRCDLAVLKISGSGFPTCPWGDSDKSGVGDIVLAIGNPFGIGESVTMGIISAKGRSEVGIAESEDFIQTDAAINPGNSGGALVNIEGDLIGINTAIISNTGGYQGIGFAIPSNKARRVMEQIVRGKVGI